VDDFTPAWLASGGLEALSRRVEKEELEPFSLDGVRLGPPFEGTRKIVCAGLNYADHAAESGVSVPSEPAVFFKAANTIIGPNDDALIPVGSEKTDWEVELAIVIDNTCRYLPDEPATAEAIAGNTISNDVSERHFQLDAKDSGSRASHVRPSTRSVRGSSLPTKSRTHKTWHSICR
jgi:2-keto-4-pentenoate hydratase/2-oxohepta-3-ene-1,7-dioic acid hydratase in catechol pathway